MNQPSPSHSEIRVFGSPIFPDESFISISECRNYQCEGDRPETKLLELFCLIPSHPREFHSVKREKNKTKEIQQIESITDESEIQEVNPPKTVAPPTTASTTE